VINTVRARGRKSVLTLFEKLAVGGECERLLQVRAEQQAMATHRAQPHLRDVKKIQSEFASVPVASRSSRVWQDAIRYARSEIAEILSDVETRPIRLKRQYGKRNEILDAAIEWCAATYGKTISRRRAQDCRDTFAAMMRRREREPT
jgi:hypothetical protein